MGGLPFFWVGDVFFDGKSDGGLSEVDASFDAKGVVVGEDVGGKDSSISLATALAVMRRRAAGIPRGRSLVQSLGSFWRATK